EIGTGSGYQTAILARLARVVYSAELEPSLIRGVAERLALLGITNVIIRQGSGLTAFRAEAPFDAILSAAAPVTVPDELIEQLAEGGRAIIPVGGSWQSLMLFERREGKVVSRTLDAVQFVPLRHEPRST
ncbi:MAG TPA: protein-L-isoaspartate O-methyltransferase, partial [Thermoanaerobaculia bacterium]|nr:protein-L-isoaspartate O-methyltransferase [Thermoanaerobaculia bacterium]